MVLAGLEAAPHADKGCDIAAAGVFFTNDDDVGGLETHTEPGMTSGSTAAAVGLEAGVCPGVIRGWFALDGSVAGWLAGVSGGMLIVFGA